jgi:uncharacterized membrane protein YedE/YeeE
MTDKLTENTEPVDESARYWSTYVAGAGLGLTLLASYWLLGAGLGASSGLARLAAWLEHLVAAGHVERSTYFGAWYTPASGHVLAYYLVFMMAGVFLGGIISAIGSGRVEPSVERGPRISRKTRLILALGGGILVGFASRLARGCTSGQALSGTALLLSGSIVFLLCLFAAAFVTAIAVRRAWR